MFAVVVRKFRIPLDLSAITDGEFDCRGALIEMRRMFLRSMEIDLRCNACRNDEIIRDPPHDFPMSSRIAESHVFERMIQFISLHEL